MVLTSSLGELIVEQILWYYLIAININDRAYLYIYIYIYIYPPPLFVDDATHGQLLSGV